MHIGLAILIALIVAMLPDTSRAQQPDEVGIVRAATLFVRDSLGSRLSLGRLPIVIDAEFRRNRPALNPVVADQLAAQLRKRRGRVKDMVHCALPDTPGARHEVCTMRGGNATIVALSQPTVRNGSAELDLTYIFLDDRGRVRGESLSMIMTRSGSGPWRVERADVTGAP
jgi:hypothetical protein